MAETKTTAKSAAPVKNETKTAAATEKKTIAKTAVKATVETEKKPSAAKAGSVKATASSAAKDIKENVEKTTAAVSKPVAKAEAKPAAAEVKKAETPKKEKGKKKAAPYVSNGEVRVELVHSTASCTKKQIRTVQALGLKKLNDVHVHKDNPAIQGMIKVVAHLVRVEKVK